MRGKKVRRRLRGRVPPSLPSPPLLTSLPLVRRLPLSSAESSLCLCFCRLRGPELPAASSSSPLLSSPLLAAELLPVPELRASLPLLELEPDVLVASSSEDDGAGSAWWGRGRGVGGAARGWVGARAAGAARGHGPPADVDAPCAAAPPLPRRANGGRISLPEATWRQGC
jgi:hypothetical protein